MKFKFHLYVQKHQNQTYTVTPIPFYDLSTFGPNIDDVKTELAEAIKERVEGMAARMLQHIEFDPRLSMRKVQVELRPVDRKKRKKRREQVQTAVQPAGQARTKISSWWSPCRAWAAAPDVLRLQLGRTRRNRPAGDSRWLDEMTARRYSAVPPRAQRVSGHARSRGRAQKGQGSRQESLPSLFDRIRQKGDNFWALKEVGVNMTAAGHRRTFPPRLSPRGRGRGAFCKF